MLPMRIATANRDRGQHQPVGISMAEIHRVAVYA
jgi:hypothetical protein